MMPVFRPLSQWSNQRTASRRHSMPGFGYGRCGSVWFQAPTMAFTGADMCCSMRGTLSR